MTNDELLFRLRGRLCLLQQRQQEALQTALQGNQQYLYAQGVLSVTAGEIDVIRALINDTQRAEVDV